MKRAGRKLELFPGQMQGPGLEEKVGELMWRYNNRNNTDMFLVVLFFMLVMCPCCGRNYVLHQVRTVLGM